MSKEVILLLILIIIDVSVFFSAFLLYQISALGITAGAHRLWSHKSYKARLPLRILLAFFNLISFQVSL